MRKLKKFKIGRSTVYVKKFNLIPKQKKKWKYVFKYRSNTYIIISNSLENARKEFKKNI